MAAAEEEELARWQARVGGSIRGKWTLDGLLGVGGMAAVYSATHKIGRRDAIKILHPEVAVSRELRARFEQEALAVGKLGHPGAVQVIDIDVTEDGAPFLVMELLEGENLGQRAHRLGGLAEDELLAYADQLLDVLGAAHALGIVHRDIKPDNLFVTKDGRLKVLDFGIARMKVGGSGLKTRTGAMMGTTSYMAPEQVHGREVDGRADLFAVGATLFRILAKRKLHEAISDADLLVKMGSAQAPPIRSVAPAVSVPAARVIDKALAFDVDRRYPDAPTMRADVQAVLRGEDPPFAAREAARAESATRAEGLGASPAGAALVVVQDATGVTQPAPASTDPARSAAAPAGLASGALATAGLIEPTGASVVLAQPNEPRRETGAPRTLALVLGATMVLAGVALGALYMLSGDGRAAANAAAARVERGESSEVTEESAASSSEAPAQGEPSVAPEEEEPAPAPRPTATGGGKRKAVAPPPTPTGEPLPLPQKTAESKKSKQDDKKKGKKGKGKKGDRD